MEALGPLVFSRLASAAIDVACVALVVWCILALLRPRSARVCALLWLLVPLEGVTALAWGAPVAVAALPVWSSASAAVGSTDLVESVQSSSALPVTAGPVTAGPVATWPATTWLVGLWFIGVGLQVLRSALDRVRARRLLRRAAPAPHALRELVQAHGRASGWRRPRIALTTELDSPAVLGVVRPVVLLPAGVPPGVEREWAVRHEVMHVALRDPWVGLLFEMALVVLFFHPALWFARRRWAVAAEQACDRALVRDAEDSLSYAEVLHSLARRLSARRASAPFGLFAVTSEIGRRIEILTAPPVGDPRLSRRSTSAAIALVAVVLVVGVDASPLPAGGEADAPSRTAAAVGDAPASQADSRWHNDFRFYLGSPPPEVGGGLVWESTYYRTTR